MKTNAALNTIELQREPGPSSTIEHIASRKSQAELHPNILTTIGNTPVVRINKLAPQDINLYAKIEAFNPLGSVKDRLALSIIEAAERDGSLRPGQTVIEATSGNTGIGLAMVCAQKGYPLVVTMAENFSIERRRLMRYLGAQVVLTPADKMGSGMLAKATELAEQHGWFLCRQFVTDANADVHSATTAHEILTDFPNGTLDYFVTGFGTGGTLKGIAQVLRQKSPGTRIIAAEPDNSPIVASGIRQQFDADGMPTAMHPSFQPHLMQGWSPDFMSKIMRDVVDDQLFDELIPIVGVEAMKQARELARQEGIFCGTSAGATLAGALEIAKKAPAGSNILCILPDTGERYLSTPLFEDIPSEMTEEEMAISTSTTGYRFDSAPPTEEPEAKTADAEPTAEAQQFLDSVIQSTEEPVVMFALEWCEFCWSIRKLFDRMNVKYRSVDLDSVTYQPNDFGRDIRTALDHRTGATTIPQLFVAGQHLGGCTDTFSQFCDGSLQALFSANNISFKKDLVLDPETLLPNWLHTR
ncbi:MAG: pyridoxal-phosphate dependent enzyme [Granulosicoccus sp.]|nr:pyridoxal-phosphate dependent enzyme [Granulosicoccus sp.]